VAQASDGWTADSERLSGSLAHWLADRLATVKGPAAAKHTDIEANEFVAWSDQQADRWSGGGSMAVQSNGGGARTNRARDAIRNRAIAAILCEVTWGGSRLSNMEWHVPIDGKRGVSDGVHPQSC